MASKAKSDSFAHIGFVAMRLLAINKQRNPNAVKSIYVSHASF